MTLAIERRGAIAMIRYDHPPRNFATTRLLHDLRACFQRLDRDPEIRVIVLTGARDGHFMLHVEPPQIQAMLASAAAYSACVNQPRGSVSLHSAAW